MSYLDYPRIHFSGNFRGTPSTINNPPNNFREDRWSPKMEEIELYWNPIGDGVFDLLNCYVSGIRVLDPFENQRAIVGQPVTAVYSKAPPKLVDLDPMQQNVTEIWGLLMQIGTPEFGSVRGTFEPIAFNNIWVNAQGPDAPRDSSSGSASFQSLLTNLQWDLSDNQSILSRLQQNSADSLSIKFTLSAHNNHPQTYSFNGEKLELLKQKLPAEVFEKIQVMQNLRMMLTKDYHIPGVPGTRATPAGQIPTAAYVIHKLNELLGQNSAGEHQQSILDITKDQKYDRGSTFEFCTGRIVGTIGPHEATQPTFFVPARTLAPKATSAAFGNFNIPEKQSANLAIQTFFSNARVQWASPKADPEQKRLTLDTADAVPVDFPGNLPTSNPEWVKRLGNWYLAASLNESDYQLLGEVNYNESAWLDHAGVNDIVLPEFDISETPLAVVRGKTDTAYGPHTTSAKSNFDVLMCENSEGISMRANQFSYRAEAGEAFNVNVHVLKFGRVSQELTGKKVEFRLMDNAQAVKYTLLTLGTGGASGTEDGSLSMPQDAIMAGKPNQSPQLFPAQVEIDSKGIASLNIVSGDPGNKRPGLDGNIYFITYKLVDSPADYVADSNDIITVQVYSKIDAPTTYSGGIDALLKQYGQLYPIMSNFGLDNYDSIKHHAAAIKRVLSLDIHDPLHMPVTRDLSKIRRKHIVAWFDNGMPR